MSKTVTGLIICICIIFVVPAIAFSIASFVIAGQNVNTSCDVGENSIMRLSTWLFVNGAVSLGLLLIYGTLFVLFIVSDQYIFLVLFIVVFIMNWGFIIAWNVTGAVQLFEHSSECMSQANALWVMTLVALIFQWISIFQACCVRKVSNQTDS